MNEAAAADENANPKPSRKAQRKATVREKAKTAEKAKKAAEEAWNRLSHFERTIAAPRFVPADLSVDNRNFGVYVLFDYENAMRDFPQGFNMKDFKPKLQTALRRVFMRDYKILGVYGAGTFTAFWNVSNFNYLTERNGYKIFDIEGRHSKCSCGRNVTYGSKVIYERISDRACDIISQEMSFYPTRVGYSPGLSCNVLLISGDRDLGSAMHRLKRRGVTVMLAYTGDDTKYASSYLLRSASPGYVMKFKQQVFHT